MSDLQYWSDWRSDLERWDDIAALADDAEVLALVGSYEELPFDPRAVLRCENQGPVGSCRGFSGSTGSEWIRTLATREIGVQLSPAWMYYMAQAEDRITGDRGSTIMGGVKVLQERGICRNDLWPYKPRYDNTRPSNWQEVLEDAAKHKIGRANRITSYDGVRAWLGSGQGYVDCGIPWSSAFAKPVVERFGGGNGGHAIALIYLSERKDSQGRPFVWMFNSHGERSGVNGWSEWSPDFIEAAIRSRSGVFVGLSDMPNVKPREVDWIKDSPWL